LAAARLLSVCLPPQAANLCHIVFLVPGAKPMPRSLVRPLLCLGALALVAACNPKSDNPPQQPGANPAATIPSAADETTAPDFVRKATASDMYEIQAA